jgi:dTDP-4-dehydrorhamnose reductase
VHYSTDFVFDGETTRPYTEEDEPRPRSNYGMSKLLGEWLALERSTSAGRPTPKTWVLRVESLFGDASPGRAEKGSVHAIISRIRQGAAVPVFVDRTVSPTYTRDVTRATRAIVASNAPTGLYHGVNSGSASWADIAQEIGKILGLPVQLEKVTLESANLKASRPRYCALSNAKLASVGISMPSWQDALGRHLQ